MARITRTLVLAAAALSVCFTSPAMAGGELRPSRAVQKDMASAPAPGGGVRPALWKVTDSDTTIWLFGTIHALPDGVTWMDGPVARAFGTSQTLVTEIADTKPEALQPIVMKLAMLPKGQNLHALLSRGDAAKLDKTLKDYGLPPSVFDQYKPWFVAISLASLPLARSGYTSANGVEAQLAAKAKADERPQQGLETPEYQLGIFDHLPREVQLRYLREVLRTLPKMTEELRQLVRYWSTGNPDRLARLLNEDEDDPKMMKVLLVDRNRNWANWIKGRMEKPGSVFIAVGAGHLAGPQSVQAQLTRLGYRVTRVQ